MCLILISYRASAQYPLVIAANRDEAYSRPALPADRWSDCPSVYGGRDLQAGGAWLAVSETGRYAALTNFRQGGVRDPGLRSRGELVADYLCGTTMPGAYLDNVRQRASEYNGFSMLAGDAQDLYFYSNRGNGLQRVSPGIHGLSNHLLDEPWPKVVNGVAALESWLALDVEPLAARLYEYLGDRTIAPDHLLPSTGVDAQRERQLSAAFIADERYGTRTSSVIIVCADGDVYFGERAFGTRGAYLYDKTVRFRIRGLSAAAGSATPFHGEVSRLP
ncbi:MAG: NRDE family protein [Rhodospirillaceae bacterium]